MASCHQETVEVVIRKSRQFTGWRSAGKEENICICEDHGPKISSIKEKQKTMKLR